MQEDRVDRKLEVSYELTEEGFDLLRCMDLPPE